MDDPLSERMAALARELGSQASTQDIYEGTVDTAQRSVRLADTAGLTVFPSGRRGPRRADVVAVTDPAHEEAVRRQVELDEGPCLAVVRDEAIVVTEDLAHDSRWPAWGPRVHEELGLRSALAVRLYVD